MHQPFLAAMARLLRRSQPRHDLYTVFGDCMETIAISLSNSVDLGQREAREACYLEIVSHYQSDIVNLFPEILAQLVLALETEPGDVLGTLFHDLEFHDKGRGQFFTPYTISQFMAQLTLGDPDSVKAIIAKHGFVTAMEPACGAGSMIIALAEAMREAGFNDQQHLHVTAIDIDSRAIHMAYSQLSLLHIPAHLLVGNSLSGEIREHWYTPAHILGGWNARLTRRHRCSPGDVMQAPPFVAVSSTPRERPAAQPGEVPDPIIAKPRQLSLF